MSRNMTILKWGAPIAAISYMISSMIAFSAGLSMRAMVEAGEIAALESASVAAPVFVLRYTPGVVAGLVLAALLAAIMSTSDSFLNIGAAAISRDIPRALGRPIEEDRTELRVTQGALVVLTVLSTFVVFFSDALVGILGTIGWGFFAAAFFPIAVFGLNWKGATKEGAIAGIVGGLVVNLLYSALPRIAEAVGATAISEGILAFYPFSAGFPVGTVALLVSISLTIGVSIATQDRQTTPADLVPLLEQ
jgi:sodium/proline symporter/sodium/pantothenate symporter